MTPDTIITLALVLSAALNVGLAIALVREFRRAVEFRRQRDAARSALRNVLRTDGDPAAGYVAPPHGFQATLSVDGHDVETITRPFSVPPPKFTVVK